MDYFDTYTYKYWDIYVQNNGINYELDKDFILCNRGLLHIEYNCFERCFK